MPSQKEKRKSEDDAGEDAPEYVQSFEFVNFTQPGQHRAASVQRSVRSHAMREYRRRTRATRESRYLDVTPLLDSQQDPHGSAPGTGRLQGHGNNPAVPGSIEPRLSLEVGASQINPFIAHGHQTDSRIAELFHHLFEDTCSMFKIMRNVGFFAAMMDSAGFQQALSSAAWHREWLHGRGHECTVHLPFYNAAVQSINARLLDPAAALTDETLAVVTAFASQAIMMEDLETWKLHFEGLTRIISAKAGLSHVDDRLLRLMIQWIDITGAAASDSSPQYPLLPGHFPQSSTDCADLYDTSSLQYSMPIRGIFAVTTNLAHLITVDQASKRIWDDPVWSLLHTTPALHYLLSTPQPADFPQDFDSNAIECARVTAILYVRHVQMRFGISTTPAAPYVSKLEDLLSNDTGAALRTYYQADYPSIVAIGIISAVSNISRAGFVRALRHCVRTASTTSLEDILDSPNLPRIKGVFDESFGMLIQEVSEDH